MGIFRKKETTQDINNFEHWVIAVIEQLDLDVKNIGILAVLGGILILIKNQGILWVPYKHIKEITHKVETKDLGEPGVVISSLVIGTVLNFSLPAVLMSTFGVKRLFEIYAKSPPERMLSVINGLIADIEIKNIQVNRLQKGFKAFPVFSEEDYPLALLEINLKLSDQSKRSIIQRGNDFIKKLLFQEDHLRFLVTSDDNLLRFVNLAKKSGLEVRDYRTLLTE